MTPKQRIRHEFMVEKLAEAQALHKPLKNKRLRNSIAFVGILTSCCLLEAVKILTRLTR